MRKSKGFTLIELLVVIAIISLLMAILMPALGRARKAAKTSVCLSNLHQYSLVATMYCNDNDGYFHSGWFYGFGGECGRWPDGRADWEQAFRPYYMDKNIRFCPEAKGHASEKPDSHGGTWKAWGPTPYDNTSCNNVGVTIEEDNWGSYMINQFVHNHPPLYSVIDGYRVEYMFANGKQSEASYFRHIDSRPAGKIPLFTGGTFITHDVLDEDLGPLPFENIQLYVSHIPHDEYYMRYKNMGCVQMNRHSGTVGGVFLDGAARRIPLKELWSLKWSKIWDTCGPWTRCGEPDSYTLEMNWDAAAPWMANMPEY